MDGPVVLVDAESDVERGLVTEWLRTHDVHPREVLPIDAKALAEPLASLADDVPSRRCGWRGCPASARAAAGCAGRTWCRWTPVRAPARGRAGADRAPRAGPGAGGGRASPPRSASCAAATAARARTGASRRSSPGRPPSPSNGPSAGCSATTYKVPRLIAEAIEDSPEYRQEVAELAARLELPEAEVARRASADLAGLVASMSPIAVDLFTGALRPFHSQAWNVQVDEAGLARLRERNRTPPAGVPAQPPQLRRPAGARRRARRARLPAQPRARRRQPALLAGRPAGQAGRAWCSSAAASATTRSTSSPSASTSATCWPSGSTWSGTWRAAARAPASCARRATACWPTSPRRSSRAASTTSTSCRCRSPTTSCARCRRWPPSRSGRRRRPRGVAWLARYARAQLEPLGIGLRPVRRADLAARRARPAEPDRRLALQKVAFEVCVGINRVTPVVATALVTLALLGVRDRALTLAQVRQVLGPVRGYLEERGLVGAVGAAVHRHRAAAGARRAGAVEGRHDLRGRRGAGVRDRARPAPRRGVLPQHRDPPLRRPRDRRAGAARRARGPLGRRVGPARPAEVRVLLPRPRHPPRPAHRRARPDGRGLGHARRPRRAGGRRVPHRPPGAALVRRRPARGGAAAGRPQPAHPRRREGVPRRVRRRRAADAAAGTAARAGVALARAVRQRAEARRQPRPRRRGPRGARQAARGVRRAAGTGGGRRAPHRRAQRSESA